MGNISNETRISVKYRLVCIEIPIWQNIGFTLGIMAMNGELFLGNIIPIVTKYKCPMKGNYFKKIFSKCNLNISNISQDVLNVILLLRIQENNLNIKISF